MQIYGISYSGNVISILNVLNYETIQNVRHREWVIFFFPKKFQSSFPLCYAKLDYSSIDRSSSNNPTWVGAIRKISARSSFMELKCILSRCTLRSSANEKRDAISLRNESANRYPRRSDSRVEQSPDDHSKYSRNLSILCAVILIIP